MCGEGQQLHVSKAWFGRLAHDTDTCVEDVDVKAGNTSLHLQPDLARDCGVSVLGVKETWCRDVDSGAGCSIAVESLGVGVPGGSPCPVTVTKKYLYLEFACSRDGQASGALANTAPVRLFAMYLLMMSAGHALLASTLNNLNLV